MFCPACNTNLDDVPVDDPCPTCAAVRRSAVVKPEPVRVTATARAPSIGIGRDYQRPWHEKWREVLRALAGGCTPEHLAAVTGFDLETVKRLLHKPRQEFNGRHPTDPHAPGQEQFYR
jgi:hypothetical protein